MFIKILLIFSVNLVYLNYGCYLLTFIKIFDKYKIGFITSFLYLINVLIFMSFPVN